MALVERFATMAALAYEAARQREHLRHQAATDGLTGLLNHRGSQEVLRREIEAAAIAGTPLSVVVVDLDHFKRINDSHGHAEGDKALAAAAAKLRSVVRAGDAVGRLGGEEFVLVLPGVAGEAAAEAAERARAALAEVQVGRRRLQCSAGVATFPGDAQEAAELLERADAALYAAKHAGRRQTRRYAPNLAARPSRADERGEVEALLRRGDDAMHMVFQPVLELATGRVCGYEALARIDGEPVRRPDQWFAQAHRCGLGAELEALALHAALAVPDRPAGHVPRPQRQPAARCSRRRSPTILPADLSDVVIELTEHELFTAEDDARGVPRGAARAWRARRARRRRRRLRRPPAADPRRARHPQDRPLARARRAQRPVALRAARGARLASPARPAPPSAARASRTSPTCARSPTSTPPTRRATRSRGRPTRGRA